MNTDQALAILDRYQADILATIAATMALVDGEPIVVQRDLAEARWQLTRQMRAYQLFKHSEIFGPTIRFGTRQEAELAAEAAAVCTAHGDAFKTYVAQWSGRDLLHDWPEYRSAVKDFSAALCKALAIEKVRVARLVSGIERTRQVRR